MLTSLELLNNVNSAATTDSETSLSQLGEDYNKFLTLLTAQISNQDPLEPVDSTQFVAQLAQLSQVEQAVQTNANLETLTGQIGGLLNLGGTDLLGKEVAVESDLLVLDNGSAQATYQIEDGAVDVTAQIFDTLGRSVRTLQGLSAQAGVNNPLSWDGNDDAGNAMLSGEYTVQFFATDTSGEDVPVYMMRSATVEQVMFTEGEILFGVTGGEIVSSVTISSAS